MQTLLTQRAANSHLRCVSGNWTPAPKGGKEKSIHLVGGESRKVAGGMEMGWNPLPAYSPKDSIYTIHNTYILKILCYHDS